MQASSQVIKPVEEALVVLEERCRHPFLALKLQVRMKLSSEGSPQPLQFLASSIENSHISPLRAQVYGR